MSRLQHLLGRVRYNLRVPLLGLVLALPLPSLRAAAVRRLGGVRLPASSGVGRGLTLLLGGEVTIGEFTYINGGGTVIDARGPLTIGSRVDVSKGVKILCADHDLHAPGFGTRYRGLVIEDRVWLATNAIVLPGSHLREGTVVAAGAVFRGTSEPDTVYAGNPAVAVGTRSADAQSEKGVYRELW